VELNKVTFGPERKTEDGRDYYFVNPMGAVPAMELDSGDVLTENAVLLQYLAALKPEANLEPQGSGIAHWRFLETLNFIATELHKSFSPLFAKPPEEFAAKQKDKIGNRFDLLQQRLGANDYLAGNHFTVADAYAFTIMTWAPKFGIDLARWPKLKAYFDRVKARPGVAQALSEEGLTV
jgi:glutathione S-transferase